MTAKDILKAIGMVIMAAVAVTILGIYGFVLIVAVVILMFCGVPIAVVKNGKRTGYIRWGRFYRDEDPK